MFSDKQKEYIQNANHRWNLKTGATQSGKTYLDYTFIIPFRIRERINDDGLVFILGVSKSTIERNILEPMRQRYGAQLVGTINQQNQCYLFGETVYCLGAEKVSQVSKLRGASVKYCYGDELADWNEEVFQMLKSRLSKKTSCFDGALNPQSPTHWAKKFIDSDVDLYVQSYQIDDNPFLPAEYVEQLKKEYFGTVYYDRYILGLWKRAEGCIFPAFVDNPNQYIISEIPNIWYGIIGVDFGGTKSAHSFTFTGFTAGYKEAIVIAEYYRKERIDPEELNKDFIEFVNNVRSKYKVYEVYADSAEQTLIAGMESALIKNQIGLQIKNAKKGSINNRIALTISLMARCKLKIHESCVYLIDALKDAVYDTKSTVDVRLDDGTVNMDSIDSFEYSLESVTKNLLYRSK